MPGLTGSRGNGRSDSHPWWLASALAFRFWSSASRPLRGHALLPLEAFEWADAQPAQRVEAPAREPEHPTEAQGLAELLLAHAQADWCWRGDEPLYRRR